MSALQKIKDKLLISRKARNKDDLKRCQTIIGDLEKDAMDSSEEITDKKVFDKVAKYITNNNANIKILKDSRKDYLIEENKLLTEFLPEQLNEEKLSAIILENNLLTIKDGMIFLSSNYSGRYDKGLASSLIKKFISK